MRPNMRPNMRPEMHPEMRPNMRPNMRPEMRSSGLPAPSGEGSGLLGPRRKKREAMETIKYVLSEEKLPRAWYNLAADLPTPPPPPLHPGTLQPLGPEALARCSRRRSSPRKSAASARSRFPIRCARSIGSGDPHRSIARVAWSESSIHQRASTTSTKGKPIG